MKEAGKNKIPKETFTISDEKLSEKEIVRSISPADRLHNEVFSLDLTKSWEKHQRLTDFSNKKDKSSPQILVKKD